jgi:hypothetical protein
MAGMAALASITIHSVKSSSRPSNTVSPFNVKY